MKTMIDMQYVEILDFIHILSIPGIIKPFLSFLVQFLKYFRILYTIFLFSFVIFFKLSIKFQNIYVRHTLTYTFQNVLHMCIVQGVSGLFVQILSGYKTSSFKREIHGHKWMVRH